MILSDIKSALAALLHRNPVDLIINGIDFGLLAFNSARQRAELDNDFNFTRMLLDLPVDGVVGGSIDNAVEHYTQLPTTHKPKTIIDVGQYDTDGNLLPVEWTTVPAGLDEQRRENPQYGIRYPTDAQAQVPPLGIKRFIFTNRQVFFYPKTTTTAPGTIFTIGFECYTFTPDWTVVDLNTAPEPWATKAWDYLLWWSVIFVNNIFRDFVFRQEGNLQPPEALATSALESLRNWDMLMYETFRRHSR